MVVEALRKATSKPLDVHLMIVEPEKYIDDFAHAGADIIGVHVETCPHLHRAIEQIRNAGKRASVVLNPHTPLEMIHYVLPELQQVLIMSVNPGFGGQSFIPAVIEKIRKLRNEIVSRLSAGRHRRSTAASKIDNVARVAAAGANVIVAGSAVFGAGQGDYKRVIAALRKNAEEASI